MPRSDQKPEFLNPSDLGQPLKDLVMSGIVPDETLEGKMQWGGTVYKPNSPDWDGSWGIALSPASVGSNTFVTYIRESRLEPELRLLIHHPCYHDYFSKFYLKVWCSMSASHEHVRLIAIGESSIPHDRRHAIVNLIEDHINRAVQAEGTDMTVQAIDKAVEKLPRRIYSLHPFGTEEQCRKEKGRDPIKKTGKALRTHLSQLPRFKCEAPGYDRIFTGKEEMSMMSLSAEGLVDMALRLTAENRYFCEQRPTQKGVWADPTDDSVDGFEEDIRLSASTLASAILKPGHALPVDRTSDPTLIERPNMKIPLATLASYATSENRQPSQAQGAPAAAGHGGPPPPSPATGPTGTSRSGLYENPTPGPSPRAPTAPTDERASAAGPAVSAAAGAIPATTPPEQSELQKEVSSLLGKLAGKEGIDLCYTAVRDLMPKLITANDGTCDAADALVDTIKAFQRCRKREKAEIFRSYERVTLQLWRYCLSYFALYKEHAPQPEHQGYSLALVQFLLRRYYGHPVMRLDSQFPASSIGMTLPCSSIDDLQSIVADEAKSKMLGQLCKKEGPLGLPSQLMDLLLDRSSDLCKSLGYTPTSNHATLVEPGEKIISHGAMENLLKILAIVQPTLEKPSAINSILIWLRCCKASREELRRILLGCLQGDSNDDLKTVRSFIR